MTFERLLYACDSLREAKRVMAERAKEREKNEGYTKRQKEKMHMLAKGWSVLLR